MAFPAPVISPFPKAGVFGSRSEGNGKGTQKPRRGCSAFRPRPKLSRNAGHGASQEGGWPSPIGDCTNGKKPAKFTH
jgi:hypothetical protein